MSKFTNYQIDSEVKDIMEALCEAFPVVFEHFDPAKVGTIKTEKKNLRRPVKLVKVGYPREVFCDVPFIVEVYMTWWKDMTDKQKNLALFHVMCSVRSGAFDESSNDYGKTRSYDYEMYKEEFAVTGGVPNWMENDAARDPIEVARERDAESDESEDGVRRMPITSDAVGAISA